MPLATKRTTSTRRVQTPPTLPTPSLLRDYMDGNADLVRELESRYHSPPLMSLFRVANSRASVRTAVLATQDGAATLTVELDSRSGTLDWTYRLSAMLGQRFSLRDVSDRSAESWLAILRDTDGEAAFLWNADRWQNDYLIASAHRYYTNIFAFSAHHAEAAARLTPEAARKLLDWLNEGWFPSASSQQSPLNW
jgi:hypothetical protein